jgi:hypothetical protein
MKKYYIYNSKKCLFHSWLNEKKGLALVHYTNGLTLIDINKSEMAQLNLFA